MWIKLFGFGLAAGVVLTSSAIALMGARWQRVEASVYSGERRPFWYWLVSALVISLYAAALMNFVGADKTLAGWILVIVLPVGWAAKVALVTFNRAGRQSVSNLSGNTAWLKVAVARLPAALLLGVLAWLA